MKRFTWTLALACVMAWAGGMPKPAHAQDTVLYPTQGYIEGLRTKDMMHMIDANHDGMVSRDEWKAWQERVFDAMDKNKDGFLTSDEFFQTADDNVIPFATQAYSRGLRTKEMFAKIDANGDGKVSKQEFVDYQMKVFDTMDKQKKQQLGVADFILQK
jgi:Ca2+-binding EF-hand superfamily protein